MSNKIALAADHAGFELKEFLKKLLIDKGFEVVDYGTNSTESVDYPDFAHKMGQAIDNGEIERGIALCGTGNGISMTLNKHRKVRCALSWNKEIAALGRQHNDANVLALPARFITPEEARGIVETFLNTAFEGGRHARRVGKIAPEQ